MNAQNELRALGFTRAGAIRPVDDGKSCKAVLSFDIDGHAVFALVVGDEIQEVRQDAQGTQGAHRRAR